MFVEDFESFFQQSEDLFVTRPLETRYSIKYRHVDGKLVLKVTDDRTQCLKFVTDQQTDLKKLERLSALFFGLMSHDEQAAAAAAAAALEAPPAPEPVTAPAPTASQQQASKKSRKKG